MKVSIFAGTRPEVIKLAPVRTALLESGLDPIWVATGQHDSLAAGAYEAFGFQPDIELNAQWDRSSLTSMASTLQVECQSVVRKTQSDYVLVQGDTATAYAGAMAGFYCQVPVGHVEAGLRTETIRSPFPEEGYRRLIGRIAEHHFTPTRLASQNLSEEGIQRSAIFETGNTVIDSVLSATQRAQRPQSLPELDQHARIVLVTAHRRENWDEHMDGICEALKTLRDQFDDIEIVMPVHANPRVKEVIENRLANEPRIHLIGALPYLEFVWLMNASTLILSDSGGVQEEAAALNTPVLVMRESTERTEAIKAGTAKLVGNNAKTIVSAATMVLNSLRRLNKMRNRKNPFGDGMAATRIADIIATSKDVAMAGEIGGKTGGVYFNPARHLLGRRGIQPGLVANRA